MALTAAAPPRRTQAERRAETRAKLLDATLECLAELGYAGTTTTEVVKRAGLSRGAQVHHFPTKAELVVAAVEHLFQRRHEEFRAAFDNLPTGERSLNAAIDLMWQMFKGPTFDAWLELVVAGRTDPELRAAVIEVTNRFDEGTAQIFADFFPDVVPDELKPIVLGFAMHLMNGAAISRMAGIDDTGDASMEILKALAVMPFPPEYGGTQ
jgi:AcrR family transcriptional regulator